MPISHIFITHSSRDADQATRIRDYLEKQGIRCWMAPRDIPVGEEWAEAILNGIETASGMLLVFSSHSNDSHQVRREIERAINKGIPVFPVRIENSAPSRAMEYYISSSHWMDVFEGSLEDNLTRLVSAIKTKMTSDELTDAKQENLPGKEETSPKSNEEQDKSTQELSRQASPRSADRQRRLPLKRITVAASVLVCIAAVLLLKGRCSGYPSGSGVLEGSIAFEPFLLRIEENGYDLTATSIEGTQDGGYVITGRREPLDEGEDWIEIWVKKLDSEGNEEWEYSDRDSFGLIPTRQLLVEELNDSSFLCAFSIAVIDSLLQSIPQSRTISLPYSYRDVLTEDSVSFADGVGFTAMIINNTGDVIQTRTLRWETGSWERCCLHGAFFINGSIYIILTLYNVNYYGHSLSILIFNNGIGGIFTSEHIPSGDLVSDVMLHGDTVLYCTNIRSHTHFYLNYVHLDDTYHSILRSSVLIQPPRIDPSQYVTMPLITNTDMVVSGLYYIKNYTITPFIMSNNLNGDLVWIVPVRNIEDVYQTMITDAIFTTDRILFAGATTSSTGIRVPIVGCISHCGDYQWTTTIPIEGESADIVETKDHNMIIAVNTPNGVMLIKMDYNGFFGGDGLHVNDDLFNENWSNGAIDHELWEVFSGCVVVDVDDSRTALRVISGDNPQSIRMRRDLLVQDSIEVMVDVKVESTLFRKASISIQLMSTSDTQKWKEDDVVVELRWNYGDYDSSDYVSRSLSFSYLEEEGGALADSGHIHRGDWNRLGIRFTDGDILFVVNGEVVAAIENCDAIDNMQYNLCLEATSYATPIYIDDIKIINIHNSQRPTLEANYIHPYIEEP